MTRPATEHRHSGNLSPEFALLGLLIAGPDHGYNLYQRMVRDLGHVWHLSQSQSYAILKRLENRADISVRLVEQHKLPDRQMLRITAQGRRRFMEWLKKGSAENARGVRLEFLTRLYFSELYTPKDTRRIFTAQFSGLTRNIGRLVTLLHRVPPEQTYNRLSLELRLRQLKVIKTWMAEARNQFLIEKELPS